MSLADYAKQPANRLPRCSVGRALVSIPEADAQLLQAWMDDPEQTDAETYRSMKAYAKAESRPLAEVAEQMIGKHRRGLCSCH